MSHSLESFVSRRKTSETIHVSCFMYADLPFSLCLCRFSNELGQREHRKRKAFVVNKLNVYLWKTRDSEYYTIKTHFDLIYWGRSQNRKGP
jgi:hypothetical protein